MNKPKDVAKELNDLKGKISSPDIKQAIDKKLKYVNKPINK